MTTTSLEKKANEFYLAADYEEAIRFCDRLCKRKKNDYDAWELKALTNLKLGHQEQALQDALTAFELNPDQPDSLELRSKAYSANGRHEEAIDDLNEVIGQSPQSAALQVDLGFEFERLGQYEAAIDCYKKSLELNENYSPAWTRYSCILSMASDWKWHDGNNAKRLAARAVKDADSESQRCAAWEAFSAALARMGDFKRAQKAAKKALTFTTTRTRIREIKQKINGYKKSQPAEFPKTEVVRKAVAESTATAD